MITLGNKLSAIKTLREVMENLTDAISADDADTLNAQFVLFNKGFVLQKDEHNRYNIAQAKALYERCRNIVKKEYSAKFLSSMALQSMLEESD